MTKILHIGGINSPHVNGIIEQIKQHTKFEQSVISYPANFLKEYNEKFFANIPIYYYNYPMFFNNKKMDSKEAKKMIAFTKTVIRKEQPDIIHGHYLSKCAVPLYCAVVVSKKPGIVVPWSTWDITTKKYMAVKIKTCLNVCSYVMCNNTKFLNTLLETYKQPPSKGIFSFPPIRLYLYKNTPPNTDIPRLFITRSYKQEVFLTALPKIIAMFPNIKITALSPPAAMNLAKKLGIYNKINFLSDMQTQEDFAKTIQQHNIVRSMAPDHGTSSTTIQAAYSGAVVLSHKSSWSHLKNNINLLECDLTVEDIQKKLIYAIKNLKTLCPMFKKNNAFLKNWDANVTWKNLLATYTTMLKK